MTRARSTFAALVMLTLGCPSTDPGSGFDLMAAFPLAEIETPTQHVDLRSLARSAEQEGWSGRGTRPGAWGVGARSRLRFHSLAGGARTLVARGQPFRFPGSPAQTVEAHLNGHNLGSRELTPKVADYRWTLATSAMRAGENELELRYAYHRAPREVLESATDPRELAVAWHALEIRLDGASGAPYIENRELVLPSGSRIRYYTDLGPGATFRMNGLAPAGAGLLVSIYSDSGAHFEANLEARGDSESIPLPPEVAGIAQIDLEPVSSESHGEIRITSPRMGWPSPNPRAVAKPARLDLNPRPTHAILYVIDTLRPDRVAALGGGAGVTPRLDELAREALVFTRARAESSWTRPAVASIFTGLSAATHRVGAGSGRLPDSAHTLAERLGERGFVTAGFTTNVQLGADHGFAQGFGTYEYLKQHFSLPDLVQNAASLHARALAWLDEHDPQRPFFLYLHATDPHSPYTTHSELGRERAGETDPSLGSLASLAAIAARPPAEAAALAPSLEQLYDANLWEWDSAFGAFIDQLRERELLESTLLVVVSDHGEEFFEHGGWQHGQTLYEEQLRALWLLRFPGVAGTAERRHDVARQIDVLPTLLSALGQERPLQVEGIDLFTTGPPDEGDRLTTAMAAPAGGLRESVSWREFKLIRSHGATGTSDELYDTVADSAEAVDLTRSRPVLAGFMRTQLAAADRNRLEPLPLQAPAPDPERREALRALGYVD